MGASTAKFRSVSRRAAFLAAVVICLCGCGQPSAALSFAVGGAPAELDYWEQLAATFSRQTGIAVRILRKPSNTDQQLQGLVIPLKAHMAEPDVFLMDVAWVGLFSASNWLADLEGDIDPAPFFPNIIDQVDRKAGRLIALPVYLDAGLLYYRQDLLREGGLREPPRTWRELRQSAEIIQRRQRRIDPGFYGFVWTGAQYEGLITAFMEFAGAAGGFDLSGGRIRLDTVANVRALGFMRDLIWKYKLSPPNTYTTMREEEVRRYFQTGQALYARNWPYAWSLLQAPGSPVKGLTGLAPPPAPEGGRSVSTLGGFHIGISRFSDHRQAALAFVRFVTAYATQKKLVLALGWNPGRRDLYQDAQVLNQAPYLLQLRSVFENARPRPLVPFYPQISAIAQQHINRVIAGNARPEAALAAADRDIAALLQRLGQ